MSEKDEQRRQQIAENMRFYGDMRFKQLTLLMAWLTLAGAGVVQYGTAVVTGGTTVRQVLALATVLFTSVLWVMEVRSTVFWVANREAAPDLWPRPVRNAFRFVNATNAVLVLNMTVSVFWLWCAYEWHANMVLTVILTVLVAFLFVFSVYHYWPAWKLREDRSAG